MFTLYLIMDKIRGNNIARHFSVNYPNYTINFMISKDFPLKNRFPEFTLTLCDSDAAISLAKNASLPVIALSHEGNQNESLLGTPWLVLTPNALSPAFLNEVYCRHYHLPLTIAKTDRCLLRELTSGDLPSLILLQKENAGNPSGCFFPEKLFLKTSSSLHSSELFSEKKGSGEAAFLEAYIKNQYTFYGYGIYGIFHRETKEFVGIMGFSPARDDFPPENPAVPEFLTDLMNPGSEANATTPGNSDNEAGPANPAGQTAEVGYSLLKKWQGQKIASEALPALLAYGYENFSFSRVFAKIRPGNTASIRLARKNRLEILWED